MEALQHVLAVSVGIQGVLAATFLYLWMRARDAHLGWWAATWSLGLAVLAGWLVDHTIGVPEALHVLPVLGAIIEQILLVAGAYAFLGRRLPRGWLVAGAICITASGVARTAGVHPGIAYFPASAFTIAIAIVGGVSILRGRPGVGFRVVGWGILIWGLHLTLYPLVAGQLGDLSLAIALATVVRLAIAAGVLVAHFDRALNTAQRRESRLRVLFEGTSEGLFRIAEDGRIENANPAFAAMLGYNDTKALVGQNVRDVIAAPDRELPWRAATHAGGVEMRWRRSDGVPVLAILHGHASFEAGEFEHFDGFVRNITEERRLRTQLEQSQRMEAIGRVTGGIAHDFNNLLTVILANTAMLEEGTTDNRRRLLIQAQDAARRAADLTQHLLAFSRRQALEPAVVDLGARAKAAVQLTRPLIGETIVVALDLADEPVWVRADAIQLEQIVLNLALNARDAMPNGGSLDVRTQRTTRSAQDLRQHAGAEPGDYALLAVTDSGGGIDAEVLPHIFEPFFTTKAPGSGTGLGLSTVFGIVSQSGGHIEVDSGPGVGTTFRVFLPVAETPAEQIDEPAAAIPGGNGETVLVAEDEELLREVFQRILEQRGYRVLTAKNGVEATDRATDDRIDLLITDVAMPGMSGVELVRRLRATHPGLPVIFVSGYTERAEQEAPIPDGEAFLAKPFSAEELLTKARSVLADRAG